MRMILVAAGLIVLGASTGAVAQTGGAFNMGSLTQTLSTDGVTQSERARARGGATSYRGSSAQARAGCGRLPEFRARYGARDSRVRQLRRLCNRAGY